MAFDGGTGISTDPYLVRTAEQLNDVRNYLSSYFRQVADIDLSTYSNWSPIGDFDALTPFTGNYDGNHYEIRNITLNIAMGGGLFGCFDAGTVVKNIVLKNINYTVTDSYAGALVSCIYGNATITNCIADGKITFSGANSYCGGMIGEIWIGNNEVVTVSKCHSYVNIDINASEYENYNYIGGFIGNVGYNYLSETISINISYCSANSDINVINRNVDAYIEDIGGFVGFTSAVAQHLIINNCYSTGSVCGDGGIGGFVGTMYKYTTITQCYSYCSVNGAPNGNNDYGVNKVGGFCGLVYGFDNPNGYGHNILSYSYSTGSVCNGLNLDNSIYVNGFIGQYVTYYNTLTDCFYDSETSGKSDTGQGTPKTTAEMKTQGTYTNWDFTNHWKIDSLFNDGYPFLETVTEIYISTPEQLNNIRNYLKSKYIQTADIDLSVYANWIPIGFFMLDENYNVIMDTTFYGEYNGGNYKITNLTCNRPDDSYAGLFGNVVGQPFGIAEFRNINIENANVIGYGDCGILMALGSANIINCHIQGNITTYDSTCGGVVGGLGGQSIVRNSSANCTIISICDYVYAIGGFVGDCYAQSVSQSYAIGSITAIGESVQEILDVGGFSGCAGFDFGTWHTDTIYSDCFSNVDITVDMADGNGVGGFAGYAETVSYINLYSCGEININYTGEYVYQSDEIGGLLGHAWNMEETVLNNCYYDSITSNLSDNDRGIPKTTSQMKTQSTYENWDFDTIWAIDTDINDGYPYLIALYDAPPAPPEDLYRPGIDNDTNNAIIEESENNNPFIPIDQTILSTRIARTGEIFEEIYNNDSAPSVRHELNVVGQRVANNKFFMLNNRESLCKLFAKNEITNGCLPYSNIFYDVFYTAQYSFGRDMFGTIDNRRMAYTGTLNGGTKNINSSNISFTNWKTGDIFWTNTNYICANIDDGTYNEEIFMKPKTVFDSREYSDNSVFPYITQLYPGTYNITIAGGCGSNIVLNEAIENGGKGGTIIFEVIIETLSTLEIKKIINNGEYGTSFHVFINDVLYAAVGGGGSCGYEIINANYYNGIKGGNGGSSIGQNGYNGKSVECTGGSGANADTRGTGGTATNVYIASVNGDDYPTSTGGIFNTPYNNGGCGYAGGGSGIGATNDDETIYSFTGGGGGSSYVITDSNVEVYENSQGTNNTVGYAVVSNLSEITLKYPLINNYTNPTIYRSYITKDTGTHKATLNKLNLRINVKSIQKFLKVLSVFLETSSETKASSIKISYSSKVNFDESNYTKVPFEIMLGYNKNTSRFVSECTVEVPYATVSIDFSSDNLSATSYLYQMLGMVN